MANGVAPIVDLSKQPETTTTQPPAQGAGSTPPGLYGAGGVKSQEDVLSTTLPTGAEQLQQMLEPYLKELTNLGPEYGAEMQFLAPYLNQPGQSFQQILAGSKADESPTGSKAVSAADAAAGQAIENAQAPGFGGEAAAGKEAISAAPYEEPIQAGLAYQKYLQTYGGQPTNTQNWPAQAAQAYQGVMGSSSSSGLPSITNAASAATANTNLTATQGQTGSSPATGY